MNDRSLIGQIRQLVETGFLPDGDGIPVSVNIWLEDIIRQHEADMGDGDTSNDSLSAGTNAQSNLGQSFTTFPTQSNEIPSQHHKYCSIRGMHVSECPICNEIPDNDALAKIASKYILDYENERGIAGQSSTLDFCKLAVESLKPYFRTTEPVVGKQDMGDRTYCAAGRNAGASAEVSPATQQPDIITEAELSDHDPEGDAYTKGYVDGYKACATKRESVNLAPMALHRLVSLRKHKDKYGKDAYYEFEQPIAWRMAEETLSKIENEKS